MSMRLSCIHNEDSSWCIQCDKSRIGELEGKVDRLKKRQKAHIQNIRGLQGKYRTAMSAMKLAVSDNMYLRTRHNKDDWNLETKRLNTKINELEDTLRKAKEALKPFADEWPNLELIMNTELSTNPPFTATELSIRQSKFLQFKKASIIFKSIDAVLGEGGDKFEE